MAVDMDMYPMGFKRLCQSMADEGLLQTRVGLHILREWFEFVCKTCVRGNHSEVAAKLGRVMRSTEDAIRIAGGPPNFFDDLIASLEAIQPSGMDATLTSTTGSGALI